MTRTFPVPLERDVKRAVVKFYRQLGCVVFNLDQGYRPGGKRHGTTRQTKGLPDLLVCYPPRGVMWSHELKRPGGAQSKEQGEYERLSVRCGLPYALGGIAAACLAVREVAGLRPVFPETAVNGDRLSVRGEAGG